MKCLKSPAIRSVSAFCTCACFSRLSHTFWDSRRHPQIPGGITRYLIEVRGIGIIDVKTLFGVESVKDTQSIDMVIKLEEWDKNKEYDRLGLEDQYTEFLGNKVICHNIPVRPGRNLAVIVESAAVNYRQKKMGYNAAQELYNRVQANIAKRSE